jgi:lysophospholipase L1-like esterase
MAIIAIIIYEICYTVFYFGILFSKSTFLSLVINPTIPEKIIFLFITFSGFFVPYVLRLLRIRLSKVHYLTFFVLVGCLYAVSSWYYYALLFNEKRFTGYHSFLQMKPPETAAAIPKPPHVFRILCLGGSTTAGEPDTIAYTALLEKMLSARYPGSAIEVINGGHFFYTTQHSIIEYLFTLKELKPDVIIFFEAINDLMTSFTSPPYSSSPFRKDYGHFLGWVGSLRYQKTFEQFLAQFFYADLRSPPPNPMHFTDFKSRLSFERNIETLIEITKCTGITLILSNQAHCFSKENNGNGDLLGFPKHFLIDDKHYADEESWYDGMELFNKTMEDTAKKYSIPFVNQTKAFKEKGDFFTDAVHMTTEGNTLKAQLYFDKIIELNLIKKGRNP